MNSRFTYGTVGILYPGEMGSAFGMLLSENGFRVVTTLDGRSQRTRRLCQKAQLSVLGSLGDVLDCSDAVISFVRPGSAVQVAHSVAVSLKNSSKRLLYVDANSISPMTAVTIGEMLSLDGIDFIDASIRGLASQLRQAGVLFLSGSRAKELSVLFGPVIRVKVVGNKPGQASALKMVLSGIPKGLIALFVEVMLFAREVGMLDEALESWNEFYPGVMELVNRMLPTYPQHAGRRAEELREIERTMLLNGIAPRLMRASRQLTSRLAKVEWQETSECSQVSIESVIARISNSHITRIERNSSDTVAPASG